ncbi:MAG: cytochrome c family protein [Proteobacteria bacterium]|nr:cytochrome c family protein [Pseudomonadota bacterium]
MRKILLGALGMLSLGIVAAAALTQMGFPDFAADSPHGPVLHRLIEWARERSVARRTADIAVPTDLADAGRIRRGAGNYDAMCAGCHLVPGVENSEIRKGLYPTPPNLAQPVADSNATDARHFWIIKHGLKASGMAAWSKAGMADESIWDLTAFIKTLPSLSPEEYRRQVEASDGHSHAGMDGHGAGQETAPAGEHEPHHEAKPHAHDHGGDGH